MDTSTPLTGAELDTLVALIEVGPLWAGDVPSKAGRASLIERGYATLIVGKPLEDGYCAATYAGRDVYCREFGTTLGGEADTMREAKANRVTQRTLRGAAQ